MKTSSAAILALCLASCGDHVVETGAQPAIRRLSLAPLTFADTAPAVIARYAPGDSGLTWRRKGDEPLPVVTSMGRAAVRIAYDTPTNVRVASDLRTSSFDRVDVLARVPAGEEELLRVTLFNGRTKVLVSEIQVVRGTGSFETIEFPLSGIERLDVALSEVTVQVGKQTEWAELAEIVALDARPAALMPEPGGEARLIDLGPQARRGWGLDEAVGGSAVIPEDHGDGARLHFAYATHPGASDAKLVVERPGDVALELPLGAEEARWETARFSARAGSVTFRVVDAADAARGAWTAIAELQVETPRDDALAPLVLLFTSDTHRGDHLSRGGTPGLVDTPHLDALAARGVQFLDAYAPSNMTNPSHVALMSGLSPRDTRIVGNRAPLSERAVTIAERFEAAGWATAAAVSVQHIGHAYSGLGQGFDRFDGMEERTDYRFSRRDGTVAIGRALDWMEERSDVPLFVWVHVFDVHGPYDAPEEFTARYLAESGRPVSAALDPVPRGALPEWIDADPEKRADVRNAHARYRAAVDRLDGVIAPLLDHPRARAGVIAFTGDHGEAFGRNQLWWTHHGLYRDQLHVPLIIAAPGLEAGTIVDAPVRMIDLGATLLDAAGIDATEHPSPAIPLSGSAASEPRFALGFGGLKAAVEHEGWLLVLNLQDHDFEHGPRTFTKGETELFHIASDPGCSSERSAAERDRADRLQSALVLWLSEANDAGLATAFNVSDEAQRRLIELGYAGNAESTHAGAWYVTEDER